MKKIIILGNSGSGKSSIAKKLCLKNGLAHLDLDTLAWLTETPPKRKPQSESQKEILHFISENEGWVIEGCYSDLLKIPLPSSNELIFMNLPVEMCIANAKKRPWEPHKYESKAAQDKNLDMLIEWISKYDERNDTFSKAAHEKLYAKYEGLKTMITSNSH
jgi:adenylate kinase family enzyme